MPPHFRVTVFPEEPECYQATTPSSLHDRPVATTLYTLKKNNLGQKFYKVRHLPTNPGTDVLSCLYS